LRYYQRISLSRCCVAVGAVEQVVVLGVVEVLSVVLIDNEVVVVSGVQSVVPTTEVGGAVVNVAPPSC
jgi:hypothetical protein